MASARRHAAATPSTRPHESLRTASRPRSAQGELLLRYPRILETRVIINRPSDVAVADPECKADSHLNCVQARGNPLMGVCRRGNQSSVPFNSWSLVVGVRRGSLDTVSTIRGRSCPSLGRDQGRGAEIAT
jgi:hypothetical protein